MFKLIKISKILLIMLSFSLILPNSSISSGNNFITKFNVDEMARKYLSDFSFIRKRAVFNYGREFVYQRNDDQANLFINVGLYRSPEDAEYAAITYLNEISMVMNEGKISGLSIGDKFWWWSPNFDTNNISHILFIRKNGLFIIHSQNYEGVKDFAKIIDSDIQKSASYITLNNNISLPIINSISIEKSNIQVGESTKITIHAIDPNNEVLEYLFLPGLIKDQNDPDNVYTFIASPDYVPSPLVGEHIIKVMVINESNVVSEIKQIVINI